MFGITFLVQASNYFPAPPNPSCVPFGAEAIDFQVYKLDQESGILVVKNLGEQVFILRNDGCFSISARDFAGVGGNCILFIDHRRTCSCIVVCST
ncbi:hypothetical protein FF1_026823 [Malus domestica]